MSTWDILVVTIPHRHEQLCGLLAEFSRQWMPGLGVRVFRDNLENSVGAKRQRLLESSQADYVSFVDDDDEVAPDYVARVGLALRSNPDYVGFAVRLTLNGSPWKPANHSLQYHGWSETDHVLLRDISHLNPIKRRLALLARFDQHGGGYGEDGRWADVLRAQRRVTTEVWLGPEWAYHYRMSAIGPRPGLDPVPAESIKPLPSYPWLVAL